MLIIFCCIVRHNFEPVRLVPGALFKYPTAGAWFESQHHQFFGLLALVLACFGAGGLGGGSGFLWRWTLAVGEVHGSPSWCWFLPVLAASVLSVKLIFAH